MGNKLHTVSDLGQARRFVVKVGSSLVTDHGRGIDITALANWAQQIAELRKLDREVVLVSSGAIAEGMQRLGWKKRPHALHELQAAAAVGQMGLIEVYESCFRKYGLLTSQILLTHDDLTNRKRYLNARSTLRTLLGFHVIPIINENDSVATDEIRFGDNDTLAALVTNLIEADALIILTDQPGLYSTDPRKDDAAVLIRHAQVDDSRLDKIAGEPGVLGTGGMLTKVRAAQRAARSGAHTVIASGFETDVLVRLAHGECIGTLFTATTPTLAARKQWLADQLQVGGRLKLDPGAVKAVVQDGKSLLSIGVYEVNGEFERGEVVGCCDEHGHEIARGLINYSAIETRRILRVPSADIETQLGYIDEPELIHRDNLVLI
jgi:glutamate 5-kinase